MSETKQSLYTLFVDQLRDLYWAENHSLEIWPKIAAAASNPDLRSAFDEHIGKTHRHIERLNQVFTELDLPPTGKQCEAMVGLVKEAEHALKDYDETEVRDAALITAVQRMEHYEMAGYGSVRNYAKVLGHDHALELFQATLDEEAEIDNQLTSLAEGGLFSKGINQKAV